MVHCRPAAFVLTPLEEREFRDPQELEAFLHESALTAEVEADLAQDLAGLLPLFVCHDEESVAVFDL